MNDEQAVTLAFKTPGRYHILVFSALGAFSANPYTLTAEVQIIGLGAPCTWSPPYPPGITDPVYYGASISPSQPARTLILTHQGRLQATHDTAPAASAIAKLRELADLPSVRGIVVPVESDAAVAGAYTAWNADYCNYRTANGVAEAIRDLIDDYVNDPANAIEYIVITGADDIVPFYRSPDETRIANERDYAFSSLTTNSSPVFWALLNGRILTDDFYADDRPLLWRGRELFVSGSIHWPVGRNAGRNGEGHRQLHRVRHGGGVEQPGHRLRLPD